MARKLDKTEWGPVLDRISRGLEGGQAEIEVASLDMGDQIAAEWLPFMGIVYDHGGGLIEVALQGYDHIIRNPREVSVEEQPGGVTAIGIVDSDGNRQIVKLKEPLLLPAA